ncbi:MAG: hypothetical protein Q9160_006978 [Pyrenula sp. 1 TL-2023]
MVRQPTERRSIWADAICINQDNDQERGHQVSVMGRIYSTAKRVLICLGPDPKGHAECVASLLAQLDKYILETAKDCNYVINSFPYPESSDPIFSDPRWSDYKVMAEHPWFERGWVVQEAGLAAEAALLWGAKSIPWPSLMRVATWLIYRAQAITKAPRTGINYLHRMLHNRRDPLISMVISGSTYDDTPLRILNGARFFKLPDSRDRLYAILPLAKETFKLAPDYSRHVQEVYFEFTRDYLLPIYGAKFLGHVQHNRDTIETGTSWVPGWDTTEYNYVVPAQATPIMPNSLNDSQPVYLPKSRTLRVLGVISDSILSRSEAFTHQTSIDDIANLWRSVAGSSCPLHYSPPSRLRAFLSCLYLGFADGELKTWERQKAAYASRLTEINELSDNATSEANHYKIVGDAWFASKEIFENEEEDGQLYPFSPMLGRGTARDWEEWGIEE